METTKKVLKSRTIWTLALMLAINLANAYSAIIPANIMIGINVVLTTTAGYFKINSSQQY